MAPRHKRVDVLVVDDSEDNRNLHASYFTYVGLRVATAATGLEAIQVAVEVRPSIVIMDLSMPGMDGSRATEWLKNDKRTRKVTVVALTGNAFAGNEAKVREAGCDAFLTKPCLPQALFRRIRRYLPKSRTVRPPRKRTA